MDSFLKVWCGIFYSFTQRSFHILLMYVINAATIPNPNPNSPQSKKKKEENYHNFEDDNNRSLPLVHVSR